MEPTNYVYPSNENVYIPLEDFSTPVPKKKRCEKSVIKGAILVVLLTVSAFLIHMRFHERPVYGHEPQQLRIAMGHTPESMNVAWASYFVKSVSNVETGVQFGLEANALTNFVNGTAVLFTQDPGRTWATVTASMSPLKPSVRYFYRVGGPINGWSKIYSFRSTADKTTLQKELPQNHVLFGDMGAAFAYSLCPGCNLNERCDCDDTSRGIISENPDMILHMGDFAYDMDTNNGTTADNFFRNIEPVAASFPYMVSHGNHEDGDVSLARYTESWSHMPTNNIPGYETVRSKNGLAKNNWFYSWDAGLVHYISISTEIQGGAMLTRGGVQLIADQFHWLEQDLIKANKNRENVPWLVVNGHRSMYCSCDADCDTEAEQQRLGPFSNGTYGFEKLFFEQGVDLFLNGHEHNYERNWPTYQNKTTQSNIEPNAPIFIVTGAAGCKELHEPFLLKQPPRSAFRSNSFGYSKMMIHNKTHIRWQQIMTDPVFFGPDKYGKVIDDTWIVQSNHGPFHSENAPKSYFGDDGKEKLIQGISIDHWEGLAHPKNGLVLPEGTTWKNNRNIVANETLSSFVAEFDGAIWESNHDSDHTTVADIMKAIAQTTDPDVQCALEEKLMDFASHQA